MTPKPRQGRVIATFKHCRVVKSLEFRIMLTSLARPGQQNSKELGHERRDQGRAVAQEGP